LYQNKISFPMGNCGESERHDTVDDASNLSIQQNQTVDNVTINTNDKQIQSYLQNAAQQGHREKKLLLLGIGGSGKSTLFKSLKCIHNHGFTPNEFAESKIVIRQNLVAGIITLLQKSQELYESNHEYFKLDITNENILSCVQVIASFAKETFSSDLNWNETQKLGIAIKKMWELPAIKNTYLYRGRFSFPDNLDYFFEKSDIVMSSDYVVTTDDLLRARLRTTGMTEYVYEEKENIFKIHDVGGQRNERRKWIHQFENVLVVLFVIALNHYDAVLFEDEKRNAMHESIQLFDEICNSKWFRNSEIILFLNKTDLFKEKLLQEVPLSICFNKNAGWPYDNEDWPGPDFHPIKNTDNNEINKVASEQYFNDCYTMAITYIKTVFANRKEDPNKAIYFHVTCATDSKSLEKVFWDVQSVAVHTKLRLGGLMA